MSESTRVLIAIDWYRPAHKAGGPITSIENLVQLMADVPQLQLYIVCGVFDYGETHALDVPQETWVNVGGAQVQYWHPKKLGFQQWMGIIQRLRPDVIHLQGIWSSRFSILPLFAAKRYQKAKVVISPRGMLTPQALQQRGGQKLLVSLLLKCLGLYKGVVFHSTNDQETQEIQRFRGGAKVVQIANVPRDLGLGALVTTSSTPHQLGVLRWLFVGRLSPEKNPLLLLDALKLLSFPTQGYFIGGSNNRGYMEQFKQKLSQLPAAHQVSYVGEQTVAQIQEFLHWTHVLINTSVSENFGHAMAEALSAGVPIVVGPNTPWQQLWEDKAGVLTEYSVGGFAEAIAQLNALNHDEFQAFQAGAAKRFATQCKLEDSKKDYIVLYLG